MFWPAIVVLVVGLFMLVAGIGPLWLPILVVLLGVGAAIIGAIAFQRRDIEYA